MSFLFRVSVSLWLVGALFAPPAEAQVRGFGDVGIATFAAAQSFEAVLGSRSLVGFGGGVEADVPGSLFINVRASRIRKTGQRVFVFEGNQFDLGIPTSVTVTPLELTGGLRFDGGGRWRVVPYGGGGVGWHKYQETSRFAEPDENVMETFTGYHVLGGAEFRLARWLGAGAEAQWTRVPDSLGGPNSVAAEFDEHDLGGTTFRVKIVIGR